MNDPLRRRVSVPRRAPNAQKTGPSRTDSPPPVHRAAGGVIFITRADLALDLRDGFLHVLKDALIRRRPLQIAARIGSLHDFHGLVDAVRLASGVGEEAEAGDAGRREAAGRDHAGVADVGAGHQPRADRELHVVDDERAEELPAGRDHLRSDVDAHLSIRVLQIARGRARAEVHPLADVAVAEEAEVALVGVAEHDRVLDLATDFAEAPDARPAAHDRHRLDRAERADVTRALHVRVRADLHAVAEHHRPLRGVEHTAGHEGYVVTEPDVVFVDEVIRSLGLRLGLAVELRGVFDEGFVVPTDQI